MNLTPPSVLSAPVPPARRPLTDRLAAPVAADGSGRDLRTVPKDVGEMTARPYHWILTPRGTRIEELIVHLRLERQTATLLVDAGYVLRPGRFTRFSAVGVNALHLIPAKRVHEGLLPETSAAPTADRRVT